MMRAAGLWIMIPQFLDCCIICVHCITSPWTRWTLPLPKCRPQIQHPDAGQSCSSLISATDVHCCTTETGAVCIHILLCVFVRSDKNPVVVKTVSQFDLWSTRQLFVDEREHSFCRGKQRLIHIRLLSSMNNRHIMSVIWRLQPVWSSNLLLHYISSFWNETLVLKLCWRIICHWWIITVSLHSAPYMVT